MASASTVAVSSLTSSGAARSTVGNPGAWEEGSGDADTPRPHLCDQVALEMVVVAFAAVSAEAAAVSEEETEAGSEAGLIVALVAAALVVATADSAALPTGTAAHPMHRAVPAMAEADTAAVLTVTAGTMEEAVGMAGAATTTDSVAAAAAAIAAVIDLALVATLSPSVPDTAAVAVGIVIEAVIEAVIEVVIEAVIEAATMIAGTIPANGRMRAAQDTRENESFAGISGDGTNIGPAVGILSPLISLFSSSYISPLRQQG